MKKYSKNRKSETIEWHNHRTYDAEKSELPRIYLIGDSICNAYHTFVRKNLAGSLYTSYWATSKCITDADYLEELDFFLTRSSEPALIHFNNGLHSIVTDLEDYAEAYEDVLNHLEKHYPNSKLILSMSTPLLDEEKNSKAIELNQIVFEQSAKRSLNCNNLYRFCKTFPTDAWSDGVHFHEDYQIKQAEQVSKIILHAMELTEANELVKNNAIKDGSSETGPDGVIQ